MPKRISQLACIETTELHRGMKLFNLCRQYFTDYSKNEIREFFVSGCFIIDDVRTSGHGDEAKRVTVGSVIKLDASFSNNDTSVDIDIIKSTPDYIIIYKPPGMSCSKDNIFDKAVTAVLRKYSQNDTNCIEYMYRPEKSLSGLICVLLNKENLRDYMDKVTIYYSCLVCGKMGEVNEQVDLNAEHNSTVYNLIARVKQVTPSRQTEFISWIEFPLSSSSFGALSVNTQMTMTRAVKSLRRVLAKAGFRIVGDQNVVKKSKGIFAHISAVSIDNEIVASLPPPAKFLKLLAREEYFYEKAKNESIQYIQRIQGATNDASNDFADNSSEGSVCGDDKDDDISDEGNETIAAEGIADDKTSAASSVLVEYQFGKALFFDLVFAVSPSVMIPRRASQTLVEEALRITRHCNTSLEGSRGGCFPLQALDVGTGSGCLLISFIHSLRGPVAQTSACCSATPPVCGVGIDISEDALGVARANARLHGLESCTRFEHGDFNDLRQHLLSAAVYDHNKPMAVNKSIDGVDLLTKDVVLCNPPYSSANERHRISVTRTQQEPSLALFANGGPYGAYRSIALSIQSCIDCLEELLFSPSCISTLLTQQRIRTVFLFEVGSGQSQQVKRIFDSVHTRQQQRLPVVTTATTTTATANDGDDELRVQFTYEKTVKDCKEVPRCLVYTLSLCACRRK